MLNISLFGDTALDLSGLQPGEKVTSIKLVGDVELDLRSVPADRPFSAATYTLIGDVRIRLRQDQPIVLSGMTGVGYRQAAGLPGADPQGRQTRVTAVVGFGTVETIRSE